MKQFSVWLLPPKKVQAGYREIIDKFSRSLKTPEFEPHITLISSIETSEELLVEKVGNWVKDQKPVKIELTEVGVSTTFFQCVFLRVKPTVELLKAYMAVNQRLKKAESGFYMPHMSLVYGDIDVDLRFSVARKIGLKTKRFVADRVAIIKIKALSPDKWVKIAEFKLQTQ